MDQIYICHTCHTALKSGRIPAQIKANRMALDEILGELTDLNNLELHIICKWILFMKLVKLPRGIQKGIKGATVNVPADHGPACNLLPRLPADAHIVSLKLKRKLEYKQAYLHDTIHPEKVITALHYLKNNNQLYADIKINEDWIKSWQDEDNDMYNRVFVSEGDTAISVANDQERDHTYKQMPDMNSDNSPLDSINDSDCENSESENNTSKESNRNEIEGKDRITLEETVNSEIYLMTHACRMSCPRKPIRYFQSLKEKVTSQYHFLQTHYLKSWQIQTNFHMETVASQILREIQN